MATTVGASEAKTKLAELLDRVEQGEEIVITRRRQKRLLKLMGKLEWDAGFNYKAERERH